MIWEAAEGADKYTLTVGGTTYDTYNTSYTVELPAGTYAWSVVAATDAGRGASTKAATGGSITVAGVGATIASATTVVNAATTGDFRGAVLADAKTAASNKLTEVNAVSGLTDAEKRVWAMDALDLVTNDLFIFQPTKTEYNDATGAVTMEFEADFTDGKVYVAGYTADDRLVNIVTVEYNADGVSAQLTGEDIKKVKVFTWDNITTTMKPLYEAEIVK